jgi:hypothetical protein
MFFEEPCVFSKVVNGIVKGRASNSQFTKARPTKPRLLLRWLTRLTRPRKHRASASLTPILGLNTTATMASTNGASNEKSYFEHQRELLIGDVAASLEDVLQNMNRLNRSLEGVIAV